MARKPVRKKTVTPRNPAPQLPPLISKGAADRRFTDAEMRLPLWLRANRLPRSVVDKAERFFLPGGPARIQCLILALVSLATDAQANMLTIRQEHAASGDGLRPEIFAKNVTSLLRRGRDDILKEAPASHVVIAATRLDSLIATTKSVLHAYLSEPLDRILCDNPECKRRGRHLLPGIWISATEQAQDAVEEAMNLLMLLAPQEKQPAKLDAVSERPMQAAAVHGEDFTWVIWFGTRYEFKKGNQAESVRHLWASWERSGQTDGCGISEKTIASKVQSSDDNFRIQATLRRHPALGTMIRPTVPGAYGLFRPDSQ